MSWRTQKRAHLPSRAILHVSLTNQAIHPTDRLTYRPLNLPPIHPPIRATVDKPPNTYPSTLSPSNLCVLLSPFPTDSPLPARTPKNRTIYSPIHPQNQRSSRPHVLTPNRPPSCPSIYLPLFNPRNPNTNSPTLPLAPPIHYLKMWDTFGLVTLRTCDPSHLRPFGLVTLQTCDHSDL